MFLDASKFFLLAFLKFLINPTPSPCSVSPIYNLQSFNLAINKTELTLLCRFFLTSCTKGILLQMVHPDPPVHSPKTPKISDFCRHIVQMLHILKGYKLLTSFSGTQKMPSTSGMFQIRKRNRSDRPSRSLLIIMKMTFPRKTWDEESLRKHCDQCR